MRNLSLKKFIKKKNYKKIFTPSPSFPIENLLGLSSNFSRGDIDFEKQYKKVTKLLKKISGQPNMVSIQGPASLAIEIGLLNFVRGKYIFSLGNTPGHLNNWTSKEISEEVKRKFNIIDIKTPLPWTMLLCEKK